jgi:hypothetical protein
MNNRERHNGQQCNEHNATTMKLFCQQYLENKLLLKNHSEVTMKYIL